MCRNDTAGVALSSWLAIECRSTGADAEGCASLFFNNRCYNVAAGVYPIRWHYTMDDGRRLVVIHARHVLLRRGSTCTPNVVLPARMLRVSNP
jgi:hypothetical protein